MALPVTFATLGAGNQPLSLFDTQFGAVAALGGIPCAASAGPNIIALTPFANTPTISSYPDLSPGFIFAAAATSTGAVTLNVSGVGARTAYKWNAFAGPATSGGPAPLGASDIVAGAVYRAVPLQALNSGAGGFVVDAIGASLPSVTLPFLIDGGGSVITTGAKGFIPITFPCLILNWSVIGDQSGSIAIDILRANNAVPVTSIVGAGTKPNLTASQYTAFTVPSGWTATTFGRADWLGFSVTSVATVTRVTIALDIVKT